jgi:UDP:flavonoid glycosyltransferase YjiC (YdhE family)
MARILVATAPVASHFYPVSSVVQELVKRGHTVWWYTGKAFQSKIEGIGATYKPMSAAYDFGGMSRDEAFPQLSGLRGLSALMETIKALFIEQAPKQMQDILSLLNEFPADILIAEEVGFGMGFVSEKTDIPAATIALSIYSFSSKDTAPIGFALPPIAHHWEGFGIPVCDSSLIRLRYVASKFTSIKPVPVWGFRLLTEVR